MAVLEKIRSRAGVLTLVIGLGLLAFILEEAVRASGAFTTNTLAAKVGDEKIEFNEFQAKSQLMQSKQDPENKQDPAQLQQQVIQSMIQESLISQECEEANIVATGSEVADMMVSNPPQSIQQFCQQNGMDPQSLLQLLKNPGKIDPNDPGLAQARAMYEEEAQNMQLQLKAQKMALVVDGCMQASNVDIALAKQEGDLYDVTYAKVDYSTIDDKSIKVTDQDLRAAYDKYKETFRIDDEMRLIHYIKVDVDPSSADRTKAAAKVNNILATLQSQGVAGVRSNNDIVLDSLTTTVADKVAFASDGKTVSKDDLFTRLLEGGKGTCEKKDAAGRDRDTYIYMVTDTYESIDSIGLDLVQVAGDKKRQDSIMACLAKGDSIEALAKIEGVNVQKSNPQQLMRPFMLPDSIRSKVNEFAAGDKYFEVNSGKEGAVFARVANKKAGVTFYKIARAKYTDYPSDATVSGLQDKLQGYLNKNKSVSAFVKNAKKAGFDIQEEMISPSTSQLGMNQMMMMMGGGGLRDTRKAVKWAFDSKPGSISQIFTSDTEMIAVAVDAVYKDYLPLDCPQVKEQLTEIVKNEKKAQMLMKEYNSKKVTSLDSYAQFKNVKVDSAQVVMASPQQMLDGRVAGTLAGLGAKAKGQIKAVAGTRAFYVVQVNNITAARNLSDKQVAEQYRRQNLGMQQRLGRILQGSRKVKNNLIKFS